MERRLAKNAPLQAAYTAFMSEYEELQHLEKVPEEEVEAEAACYLPHHAVVKQDGSQKLRVVFNASQKCSNRLSLNDFLHVGPKLQEDILALIIRWSFFKVVFSCDTVKMYRQYLLHKSDRDWQRILWRDDPSKGVKVLRLNTVTYGTASAPFLANACMLQLAKDEGEKYPKGAEMLRLGRYADDFFGGADDVPEALQIRNELVAILVSAGIDVAKWSTNHAQLLQNLNTSSVLLQDKSLDPLTMVSTLGLKWNPAGDFLAFKVTALAKTQEVTKRTMLSETAKMFDPFGWLAPVIIVAKMMLQNLWLLGFDWDAPVPPHILDEWLTFRDQLPDLEKIKIPRWLGTVSTSSWHLHGFCDASERAYGAAVYLVSYTSPQPISKLIAAKSKVSPIKVISIPKLELCGAALLAKLVKYILANVRTQPSSTTCWSDSTVVLAWLHNHPSKWNTFVANRVSFIATTLPTANWRHVSSKDNPADLASRGMTAEQLKTSDLWWKGPSWLVLDEYAWPKSPTSLKTHLEAKQRIQALVAQDGEGTPLHATKNLEDFSSFDKLVRILAYCYRWKINSKLPPTQRRHDWLSASELAGGRRILWRLVQGKVFAKELQQLTDHGEVKKSCLFRRLLPFIDADGLIRVGGRLQNSLLSEDEKHPIVLPAHHHVTTLLVEKAHRETLHGGVTLVQSHLAQQYWLIRGRNRIRAVLHRCITCARFNAATLEQQMGRLPAVRTRPARPFTSTGVDYAGPFYVRASGGRGQKAFKGYVAIFVCMITKAIHLEIVSDYTSAAFLAAYRRFTARRGNCTNIWSDHGTNFQGAEAELGRLFEVTSAMHQKVAAEIAADGTTWSYIPPRGPNFGGLWEANVKSFKRHFYRIIGDKRLTYEEFSTVSTQIEACLNSRPMSALSSNAADYNALTPGHFLTGSPLTAPPEPFVETCESVSPSSRWHLLTLMRNQFWKRWHTEYLTQLQARSRWLDANRQLSVGYLVLLKDSLTPPMKWPLARVTKLHAGADHLSRVATIRTAHSEYQRPINKLILLPVRQDDIQKDK